MSERKNRFSALLDNTESPKNTRKTINEISEKKYNNFKSDRQDSPIYNRDVDRSRNQFLKKEMIEEKKNTYDGINPNDFPDLHKISDHNEISFKNVKEDSNFLNALKKEKVEVFEQNDNIKDGWVAIKLDKDSRKILKEYGKTLYTKTKLSNEQIMLIIHNKYKKWENDYIALWGEDTYEKMFKFPNYDYKYFDKLDELYAKEMAYYTENNDDSYYSNSDYEPNDDYNEYSVFSRSSTSVW